MLGPTPLRLGTNLRLLTATVTVACLLALIASGGGCVSGAHDDAGHACLYGESSFELDVSRYNRDDVLFVIDSSPSMADERAKVSSEVARMMRAMTMSDADDPRIDFRVVTVQDLHAGVISSDMGANGSRLVEGCSARGDDGLFVSHRACESAQSTPYSWIFEGYHDATREIVAVSCNAEAARSSCVLSSPLEAALVALESEHEHNQRFLRNDPDKASARLVVVVITDKDDCSVEEPSVFADGLQTPLTPDEALVRCALGEHGLRAIERYRDGLRALHSEREYLVRFVLIAGVPPDLVDDEATRLVDFDDAAQRDAYYDRILADPRMQARVDPEAAPPGEAPLVASCASEHATAYPPRRLVQAARAFGEAGTVRSICDPDWADALFHDLSQSSRHSSVRTPGCLPRKPRTDNGRVACRMTWELPVHSDPEQPLTPTRCEERPDFLKVPEDASPRTGETGGVLCEVRQVAVDETDAGVEWGDGDGFYCVPPEADVDRWACPDDTSCQIGFTKVATPPHGVRIAMTCVLEPERDARCAKHEDAL